MMVAIIFIIITIVVETSLFIIKQNRDDMRRRKAMNKEDPLRMGPYNPVEKNFGNKGPIQEKKKVGDGKKKR